MQLGQGTGDKLWGYLDVVGDPSPVFGAGSLQRGCAHGGGFTQSHPAGGGRPGWVFVVNTDLQWLLREGSALPGPGTHRQHPHRARMLGAHSKHPHREGMLGTHGEHPQQAEMLGAHNEHPYQTGMLGTHSRQRYWVPMASTRTRQGYWMPTLGRDAGHPR